MFRFLQTVLHWWSYYEDVDQCRTNNFGIDTFLMLGAPLSKHPHHISSIDEVVNIFWTFTKSWNKNLEPKVALTCSLSLSWWPMMAEAWCGYFCLRCSRKASLFLSMSEGCMARISRELRAPPTVCLRGTPARLDLESQRLPGLLVETACCLRDRCSPSSVEVTFRLPFRGSRQKRRQTEL